MLPVKVNFNYNYQWPDTEVTVASPQPTILSDTRWTARITRGSPSTLRIKGRAASPLPVEEIASVASIYRWRCTWRRGGGWGEEWVEAYGWGAVEGKVSLGELTEVAAVHIPILTTSLLSSARDLGARSLIARKLRAASDPLSRYSRCDPAMYVDCRGSDFSEPGPTGRSGRAAPRCWSSAPLNRSRARPRSQSFRSARARNESSSSQKRRRRSSSRLPGAAASSLIIIRACSTFASFTSGR